MFELSLSRNTFSLCVICLAVTGDLVVFCAAVLLYDGRGHSYAPCILWEETINVCMYVCIYTVDPRLSDLCRQADTDVIDRFAQAQRPRGRIMWQDNVGAMAEEDTNKIVRLPRSDYHLTPAPLFCC